MKKKILSALLSTAMILSITACSAVSTDDPAATPAESDTSQTENADTAASGEAGVVYGIYKAGDQTWFIDEGAAAQEAVEAIANNAKGIVTCIPDQTMSQAVVEKCEAAGIPIVAADDALQDNDGNKIAPWVGINAYVIGQANGDWLAEYAKKNDLETDKECGLLIMTMDTVSSCVPRAEGEYDNFTAACPDFDESRIFKADYDGTTEKGNTAAAAIFTAHPEIKKWLVTGANEEGTIGACRALESAGLDADACVVGLGAYMAKDEWNNKGADGTCMKAAAYFSSDSVGKGSVDVLYKIIAGENVDQETAVDAEVVTPDTYKDIMGDAAN